MREYRMEFNKDYGIGGMWTVWQYNEPENYKQLMEEYEDSRKNGIPRKGPPIAGGPQIALFYEKNDADEYCDFKNKQLKQL